MIRRGDRGQGVKKLQEALAGLGYEVGKADGIFGAKTEDALEAWQESVGLYADGIFGPASRRKLEEIIPEHGIGEAPKISVGPAPSIIGWKSVPCDVLGPRMGFSRCTLRADVAEKYRLLVEDLHKAGAVMTTAGGRRGLGSKTSPARSRTSLHYLGRAFDLALPTGMRDPEKDAYIIEQRDDDPRRWIVWAAAEHGEEKTIDACVWNRRKKLHKVEVTRKVVNFTELAASYGFRPIRCRRSFLRGGSYGGAEWWHFQDEDGLVPGQTTFGEELLRAYKPNRAKQFIYWDDVKSLRFKRGWA